jgi:geranylgeranyl diphosphate synthase type II
VAPSETLVVFLDTARGRIDDALERYLPMSPECPAIVGQAMRYSVFAGGKRLRPILTLAAADAVARAGFACTATAPITAIDAALPAACAVELIHTYSLIHDDLPAMDNDTLRRGRPTLHVVYGDGIAILAGDGLQADAFALLAREPAGDDPVIVARKLRAMRAVADAAGSRGMVGGQAIDLQAAGRAPGHALALDADGVRAMHARKTGALIRAAAVSGAIMAGALDETISAVDRYATDLGLAFQIVDDILDVEGETGELGKTVGKDAAGAKPTYPALVGLERSRDLANQCVTRARQTLAGAELTGGWLAEIADWVVSRRS